MGEMPLAKNGIRFLRYLRQIIRAPTANKAPTTDSTLLSVIVSVRLLPAPDAPLESVTEAIGEVGTSEGIVVIVALPAEEAGAGLLVLDSSEREVSCPAVGEVGPVTADGDITTGLVGDAPVADLVERDVAEVVMVSGAVDGGCQNVQYEVGRPPLPVSV